MTDIVKLREWASIGTTTPVPDAKVDLGWVHQEQPPHEYENYQMGLRDATTNVLVDRVNSQIVDSVILEVSDETTLDEAQATIEGLQGTYMGAIFNIRITGNISLSRVSPLLDFQSISGRGAINITSFGGSYTLENTGGGGVLRFNSVTSYTIINSNLTLKAGSGRIVDVSYCRDMVINATLADGGPSQGVYSAYSTCHINSVFGAGYVWSVDTLFSDIYFGTSIIFGLPTTKIINSIDSSIHFEKLTQSMIPMGAAAASLTDPFDLDSNSVLRIKEYGTSDTITLTSSGVTTFIDDVNRLIKCFPNELPSLVTLDFPDGSYTNANELSVSNFTGKGGIVLSGSFSGTTPAEDQGTTLSGYVDIYRCHLDQGVRVEGVESLYIRATESGAIRFYRCFFNRADLTTVITFDCGMLDIDRCVLGGESLLYSGESIFINFKSRALVQDCVARSGPDTIYRAIQASKGSIVHVYGSTITAANLNTADSSSLILE